MSAAEKRLLRDVANGSMWRPTGWTGERPAKATASNSLRASLIRFLVLGGDLNNPVHEEGIWVAGAWIEDELSLHQIKAAARISLSFCHFSVIPNFKGSTVPELSLNGCFVPGLSGDRMIVAGGLFLRSGFEATGEVRLLGAQIGGSLSLGGAKLRNVDADGTAVGNALSADRMVVQGGVFFREGFEALGEVRLLGAQIGGNLSCSGGVFRNADTEGNALGHAISADRIVVNGGVFLSDGFQSFGEVRLLNARIEGNLTCSNAIFRNTDSNGRPRGAALSAGGMVVTGAFFLRHIKSFVGAIDLTAARIGTLVDDGFTWPSNSMFDGFRYDQIVGKTDAWTRIAWLKKQASPHLGSDFRPQPWEQLFAVLRAAGHKAEATEVAIAKQNMLREAGQIGVRHAKSFPHSRVRWLRTALDRLWNPVANGIARAWHRSYGLLSGYGHKPQRILFVTLSVVALSSLAYYEGRHDGLIGPTNPLVHMSARTAHCGTGGDPGAIPWTDPACPVPPEYSTFQPFFFALDVTLPFVDLHQEADWGPLVTNKEGEPLWGGRFLRWLMWFNIIFGWVASLMFVAIVSRLVEKD